MITHNLPHQSTPFVGRSSELTEIAALLSDPACRLLTLLGAGGIGKTRLALQAATEQFPNFAHGVFTVSLAPVSTPDLIASAVASSLQISFSSPEDGRVQIARYLREKQILLLMDNFEHLLDGVGLLTDILQAAPNVKFLATSRERLNVQEEWVLTLDGLRIPDNQMTEALGNYSAVQLFIQRARQVQANFSLDDNAEAVKTICQRVEGMPLGLELAASWLRAMSCAQIATQMSSSINFLSTPLRNVPERHRSLRAVFEQSWNLLSVTEQQVLTRLSVFRGGFDLEAAHQVAGATLPLLAGLVDKSLIRLNVNGRYDLHELLRQYAADTLIESGVAAAAAHGHLDYFANLAEQAALHVYGREQLPWFDRLETELNNIRAALTWSLEGGAVEPGLRLAGALGWFFQYRAHWKEGLTWLERILEFSTDADISARTKAHLGAGELSGMLGDAKTGQYHAREALALARETNDLANLAWALSLVARELPLDYRKLNLDRHVALQEEGLALFRTLKDSYGLSHALRRSAVFAIHQKDYPYARTLLDEALSSAYDVGDDNASAWTLCILGMLEWWQHQDGEQARVLFQKSIAMFREVQNIAEACYPLVVLARVEQMLGNLARSQALYEETLVLAHEIGLIPDQVAGVLLPGLATLATGYRNLERAAKLLAAAEATTIGYFGLYPRTEFERDLASVRAQLGETVFSSAWAEGKAMTWEQIVLYGLERDTEPAAPNPPQTDGNQTLIEPLSIRELEVLRLVAEGLSNAEIAYKLSLSVGTVKVHTRNIYGKLSVSSRTQAVAEAQKLRLI